MRKIGKKGLLILTGNILLAAAAFLFYFHSVRNLPEVDHDRINLSSWRSRDAEYRDGGLFVSDELRDSGKKTNFLWGPYAPLKKGSYTAVIRYEADVDQRCYAGDLAAGGESQHYMASFDTLSRFSDTVSYQFEITEDVEEFQLVVEYSGTGNFGVRSISIVPNSSRAKRILTQTLAAIVLADLLLAVMGMAPERKRTVLALAGITVLVSLPIMIHGIFLGHDLEIHLLRIESIVYALRSGQFPARISGSALWGLGYPFSVYYNDIFLYFPAVLRLAGFSVNTAYKCYLVGINLLTVILSFYAFSRIFKSRRTGLVLSFVYAAASYRFVNVYIRAAVGEYTAMAFLPLLAYALFRIYSAESRNFRQIFRDALLLAAALSGILGSHVLTMLMIAFLLVPATLVLWQRTFRKSTLLSFVLAAVMTVALNLYFLLPFMDYYVNVPTFIQDLVGGKAQMIQQAGAFPGQFFAFFQRVYGNRDELVEGRFQTTPGLILMAVYLWAVYYRIFKGGSGRFRFLLLFSTVTLVLATDMFPWNRLALHSSVWNMLAQIQFPWRFLVFAVLFLTLLAGEIPEIYHHAAVPIWRGITVASVLMCAWYASDLYNTEGSVYFHDTMSVDPERTGHEYLLSGTDWEAYDPVLRSSEMAAAEILSRDADSMTLFCRAAESRADHRVSLPVFCYKGFHVYDDSGNELTVECDEQKHIAFSLPDGYEGNVKMEFRDPAGWTAALWVSAAAAVLLAAAVLVLRGASRSGNSGSEDRKTKKHAVNVAEFTVDR